jgi:hypothetical protein
MVPRHPAQTSELSDIGKGFGNAAQSELSWYDPVNAAVYSSLPTLGHRLWAVMLQVELLQQRRKAKQLHKLPPLSTSG